jgi:hypothetical protein
MNLRLLCLLFFTLISIGGTAQCLYTLQMNDTGGDGWGGTTLTVNAGAGPQVFTLNNGADSTLTFQVQDGAAINMSYMPVGFWWQVSFQVFNNVGDLIWQVQGFPNPLGFNDFADCIACANPTNFRVDNIWDNRARLRWQPNNAGTEAPVGWRVIYGLQGFTAGNGDTVDVTIPRADLTGLQKKTWYDAYLIQNCDTTGGFSDVIGPVSFQTYWTNDIGIEGVTAPLSGCGLGMDSVKVILKNYGAAPQSLFTFRYAVNGVPAPVVPPADGFYTGILGKDSSTVVAFETLSDFSAPGEYLIEVFTELSGDEGTENDTFTYYLNNSLQPGYVQSFETWNGGWMPYGENASWAHGIPNKPSIPAAALGENAWVTQLTASYNPSELAYLESPCFDFSTADEDLALEFALIRDLEENYDGVWLELSTDGGANWEKIGGIGEGINWYTEENFNFGQGELWSGNSGGWVRARHSLPNTAGADEVRLRFAMFSDAFVQYGGFGIDNVRIFEPLLKDLTGVSIETLGENVECGLENDQIAFTFTNIGSQPQTALQVAYSINGAAPVVNNVIGTLNVDNSITYTFSTPFDSRDGAFEIKCWTLLNGDGDTGNDTVVYFISHLPRATPYAENFETLNSPPSDWLFNPTFGFSVTNSHNNLSKVLAINMYQFTPQFTADLPRMGVIQAGDTLQFSYRITEFNTQGQTATFLQGGTAFYVEVSTDCGENYQIVNTINSFNHTPAVGLRTRKISLDDFAGQSIKIRFRGEWGAGDFWFDLDNINLLSCPADMDLSADITPATPGLADGEANVTVGAGNPPYTYQWSNGSTSQTATGLEAGAYVVTVFDAYGCSDTLQITLGNSATHEAGDFAKVALFPNPAVGQVTLEVGLKESAEMTLEILDPLGRRVAFMASGYTDVWVERLDLSQYPAGIYLLRLQSGDKMTTRRLVIQR